MFKSVSLEDENKHKFSIGLPKEERMIIKVKRKAKPRVASPNENLSPSTTDVKINQTKSVILEKGQQENRGLQLEKVELKSQSQSSTDTKPTSTFSRKIPSKEEPSSEDEDDAELAQINQPRFSELTSYEKEIDELREKLATTTPFGARKPVHKTKNGSKISLS